MSFKRIKPLNAGSMKKPSMYRACVRGEKAEYWACEKLLMAAYRKANAVNQN